MIKKFLKKLAKNVSTILLTVGLVYSFATVGERWLGDSLWGLIIFVVGLLVLWVAERSWDEAKRDV
jgi:hypothetical protein